MIASFLSGQKETVVIVRLTRTLQVCTFFKVKHGTEPSSRSQCTDNPPVLSITNSGFRPGGSVRALKQMQQNYSGPDPWSFLQYVCASAWEGDWETLRSQMPTSRSEKKKVWKSSTIKHCCTHGQLSEDRGVSEFSSLFLLRHAAQRLWSTQMAATCMTFSEIFYGDFIKVFFYKIKTCLFSKGFVFFMSFWLFAFSWDFTIIFSSVGFHAKLPEYYICFSVSLGEKGQVGKAAQLSNKKVSSVPLHFRFPLLRCRIVFSSSGSDLRSIVSTSTELLPAQRLPVISSRPGPCWDDEARVFKLYVDPRLISCLAAEAQASAVYNLRLSGSSATAAVGLQLSSCCFPALAHMWAPAPSVCLQDRKSPLGPEKEKEAGWTT